MESMWACFEELEMVYSDIFGPNGVAALIQSPCGLMSVTRRGWTVAQAMYEDSTKKNLAIKILLENMNKVHKTLGDGVKTFALMEIAFLRYLKHIKEENKLTSSCIFQELQNLLWTFCNIQVSSAYTFSFNCREDCVKATSALFQTSCPWPISSHLHNVFLDWFNISFGLLQKGEFNESHVSHLKYLLNNFDILCFKSNANPRPASDSYVLSGYLIDRVPLNLRKSEEEKVQLILYIPDKDVDNFDVISELEFLIQEMPCKEGLRTLLATTSVLPEGVLFDLRERNIIVLQGIHEEDAKFISAISYQHLHASSNLITVRRYVTGTKECLYLMLPNTHQLVICAPTESLSYEYASICKNALRLMLTVATNNCGNSLVEAGGRFERSLHFHLSAQIKVRDPFIFNIKNRKELKEWHIQNQQIKQIVRNRDICPINTSTNVSKQKESGTTVKNQLLVKKDLPSELGLLKISELSIGKGNESQITKFAHEMDSDGTVPTNEISISNISLFDSINKDILAAFAQSLFVISSHLVSQCEVKAFEPIAFKIHLLQYVISGAIGFFKCDTVNKHL